MEIQLKHQQNIVVLYTNKKKEALIEKKLGKKGSSAAWPNKSSKPAWRISLGFTQILAIVVAEKSGSNLFCLQNLFLT
jgi:hypothetical protein